MFPSARLINLKISSSNNCPSLLVPVKRQHVSGEKNFRFENV